jgi:dihydroorotate dehydrogenase
MARFLRTAAVTAGIGATAFYGWQLAMINDATSYRLTDVAMSVLQQLDAERAHNFAILAAKHGCTPKQQAPDDAILHTHVLGLDFSNPIGLAAGFDKHAEAPAAIMAMGFGFVEVGSITPEPQDGNPKPRVFRLVEDNAVINRYGFNSHGMVEANKRLSAVDKSSLNGVLGVNLGESAFSLLLMRWHHDLGGVTTTP